MKCKKARLFNFEDIKFFRHILRLIILFFAAVYTVPVTIDRYWLIPCHYNILSLIVFRQFYLRVLLRKKEASKNIPSDSVKNLHSTFYICET